MLTLCSQHTKSYRILTRGSSMISLAQPRLKLEVNRDITHSTSMIFSVPLTMTSVVVKHSSSALTATEEAEVSITMDMLKSTGNTSALMIFSM